MKENNYDLILTNNIESMIYNIRGIQVMLDSDIAYLFGIETKLLNRQMKRNIDRFPEDFCFKLNSKEFKNLRCQNGTSSYGGRRYNPYVYTEHGIIALAGVIKNEIAAKMSIEIVRKFVQMRKFILENGDILLNLAKLQNKQLEFENETNKKFEEVFRLIDKLDLPKTTLFYDGQLFDAYDFISSLINKANESILLIDPYCDGKALSFLKTKKQDVNLTIINGNNSKLKEDEVKLFEEEYGPISIKTIETIHDRFLIIDNSDCYSLGSSLNYAGKKLFSIHKIEDKEIIKSIFSYISST